MGHIIETAKSGRAGCRKCRKKIAKGELRFGIEVVNDFSSDGDMTYKWHHLTCGAQAQPKAFGEALAAFDGEIPERDKLEQLMSKAKSKQKPGQYPYAEKSPSGRSKCLECSEKIEKDSIRVAIEREVDTGSFVAKKPGYLHPGCVGEHTGEDLFASIKANSTSLSDAELSELKSAL